MASHFYVLTLLFGLGYFIALSYATPVAAVNTTDPAVNTTDPAVNTTDPAVNTTGSAVNTTGSAVNTTGSAVNTTGHPRSRRLIIVCIILVCFPIIFLSIRVRAFRKEDRQELLDNEVVLSEVPPSYPEREPFTHMDFETDLYSHGDFTLA